MPLPKEQLGTFRVLQFDCYGTLIDWETGMKDALAPLLEQPMSPDADTLLAVVGRHAQQIEGDEPRKLYPECLQMAYGEAAKELNLAWSKADAEVFGNSCGSWPAFPDSAAALKQLHDLGFKLVILSNVDNESFEQTRKQLEHGFEFDGVYTAADIGSYKPKHDNFEYAMSKVFDTWHIEPVHILVVANSKFHDLEPSRKLGFKGAWIDRPYAKLGVKGEENFEPDWTFKSMKEFADNMSNAVGWTPVKRTAEEEQAGKAIEGAERGEPQFPLQNAYSND